MSVKSISVKYKPIRKVVAFYNARLLGCWLPLDSSSRPITLMDAILLAYLSNYGVAQSPFTQPAKTPNLKRKDILIPIISYKATANDKGRVPLHKATKISQLLNPFNLPLFILDSVKFMLQIPFQHICANESNQAVSRLQQSALEKKSFINKRSNTSKYAAIALVTIDAAFMIASAPIRVCKVGLWGAAELASKLAKGMWSVLNRQSKTMATTNYSIMLKKLRIGHRSEKKQNATFNDKVHVSDALNLKTSSGLFKSRKSKKHLSDLDVVPLNATQTNHHQPRKS